MIPRLKLQTLAVFSGVLNANTDATKKTAVEFKTSAASVDRKSLPLNTRGLDRDDWSNMFPTGTKRTPSRAPAGSEASMTSAGDLLAQSVGRPKTPTPSSVKLGGSMVLSHLYGQSRPASNMLESFLGKLSSSDYGNLSTRFTDIAQDVGLAVHESSGFLPGDGVAVDIPATEQGGRLLVRALHRFNQVDDRMGGDKGVQQSILPLIKSMGLDKNKAFMKGLATEAQALQLPWYMQALSAANTLLGMTPRVARGGGNTGSPLPPRNTRGTTQAAIVRSVTNRNGSTAPRVPPPATANKPQPPPAVGGSSSKSPTHPSAVAVPLPASTIPPASNAALTSALRIGAVSSDFRSLENPKRFDTYINNLNGQPMSTVSRVGATGVVEPKDTTLLARSQTYRNINFGSLVTGNFPKVATGAKHDWHLAFGSPSKLGESHANSVAFRFGSKATWSERGQLPGQGSNKLAEFWKADAPLEYQNMDTALKKLQSFDFNVKASTFNQDVIEPLNKMGFIPKGSVLATRLEQLEGSIRNRDALSAEFRKANPSQILILLPKIKAAKTTVDVSLKQIAAQAVQTRGELLMESLGSPKTTYELTVRHAAAARYMQSTGGQDDHVFDAARFKQILAAVKVEAGPESAVSLKWHRAFVQTHARDANFTEAMQQSPAMLEAWSAYKAKYGL